MCIFICTHMYIFTCSHSYTYIYIDTHTHTRTRTHICPAFSSLVFSLISHLPS